MQLEWLRTSSEAVAAWGLGGTSSQPPEPATIDTLASIFNNFVLVITLTTPSVTLAVHSILQNYLSRSSRSLTELFSPPVSEHPQFGSPIKMKPVVSAANAWSCFIISIFAIIILSVLGSLFKNQRDGGRREGASEFPHATSCCCAAALTRSIPTLKARKDTDRELTSIMALQNNHHSVTGSTKDPENGPAVAASIFTAVAVYAEYLARANISKKKKKPTTIRHAAHALTAAPRFSIYSSSWYFAAYKPSYTSDRVEEAQYR
ncbi:hypothetical protein GX48_05240 [Paracoccidioides brasiliensis]|nr:hypothetical protein GX48_05240 [Paracoccidioides brasiliensis]